MGDRTCQNCRHWFRHESDQYRDWAAERIGFRECRAIRERWRYEDEVSKSLDKYDDEDKWIAALGEALKKPRAYVQDGSDYRAQLFTGPDFSCANFEAL